MYRHVSIDKSVRYTYDYWDGVPKRDERPIRDMQSIMTLRRVPQSGEFEPGKVDHYRVPSPRAAFVFGKEQFGRLLQVPIGRDPFDGVSTADCLLE